MGATSSKELDSVMSTVSESVTSSMLNVTNSTSAKLDQNQIMDLECNVSKDIQRIFAEDRQACIKANKGLKKDEQQDCMAIQPCVMEDLKQEAMLEYKAQSNIDAELVTKVQESLKSQLEQKSENKEDAFGKALDNLTKTGSSTEEKQKMRVDTISKVVSSVDVNLLNELNTALAGNQIMSVKGQGGGVFKKLSQKSANKIVQDALSKNKGVMELTKDLSATGSQSEKNELRGLTDMLDSITGVFKGGQMVIIALVACCALLLIGGLIFMMSGSSVPSIPQIPLMPPSVPSLGGFAVGTGLTGGR